MKTWFILIVLFVSPHVLAREVRLKVVACKMRTGSIICTEGVPRTILDKAFDVKLLDHMGREKGDTTPTKRMDPKKLEETFREAMKRVDEATHYFDVQEYRIKISGGTAGSECRNDKFIPEEACVDSVGLAVQDKQGKRVAGSNFVLSDTKLPNSYVTVESKSGDLLFMSIK